MIAWSWSYVLVCVVAFIFGGFLAAVVRKLTDKD